MDATFDLDLILHDTAGIAAAGAALVGGVAQVIDFCTGAAAGSTVPRIDGRVIVDASAVTVGAGDLATVVAQFSNTAAMNAGLMNGGCLQFGDVTVNSQSADTVVPIRQELGVTNEISGTTYRYMRLFIVYAAAGALTFTARLVRDA
jgi:hypothetical protein